VWAPQGPAEACLAPASSNSTKQQPFCLSWVLHVLLLTVTHAWQHPRYELQRQPAHLAQQWLYVWLELFISVLQLQGSSEVLQGEVGHPRGEVLSSCQWTKHMQLILQKLTTDVFLQGTGNAALSCLSWCRCWCTFRSTS